MKKSLVLPFDGNDKIEEFYSQAGQDIFVLSVLNGLRGGRFLDIGCNHPRNLSNSYLLESEFGWSGIMIDLDENMVNLCKQERTSQCICGDATSLDYSELLTNPGVIDYMSVDIDGLPSFRVLQKFPFTDYKVKVITFEHNAYIEPQTRELSREYLNELGYFRLCSDVMNDGFAFEDWYIHPDLVSTEASVLLSNNKEWSNILFKD